MAPKPAPTPTPPATTPITGFDNFQTTNTQQTASASAGFASQYTSVPYPSLTQKELGLTVQTSAPSTLPAGLSRDFKGAMPPAEAMTIQQMMDNFLQLAQSDPQSVAKLQDSLILGGYLDPRSHAYTPGGAMQPGDATWDAYAHLLVDSVRQQTPFQDLLNQRVADKAGAKKFQIDTINTSVDISNPQQARLQLAQTMEQDLGRKPTNAEIATFAAQLAGDQQANPTTTDTHYDLSSLLNAAPGGPTKGATTTSRGGVDPTAEAESFDMNQHGGEMAQAQGDNVYQLFLSMLAGAGSVS